MVHIIWKILIKIKIFIFIVINISIFEIFVEINIGNILFKNDIFIAIWPTRGIEVAGISDLNVNKEFLNNEKRLHSNIKTTSYDFDAQMVKVTDYSITRLPMTKNAVLAITYCKVLIEITEQWYTMVSKLWYREINA